MLGDTREFTAVTWNLYLGADVTRLVDGPHDPRPIEERATDFWKTVVATDFVRRAGLVAARIAERAPQVVALQEVFRWVLRAPGHPPAISDFLDTLQRALEARDARYRALRTWGFHCELPLLDGRQLDVQDSVTTLVRADLATPFAEGGTFADARPVPIGGRDVPALRPWSTVDLVSPGRRVRFTNAHLEFEPETHARQAAELVERLRRHHGPGVVAGDFNVHAPGRGADAGGFPRLHRELSELSFDDAWLEHDAGAGFTSTQREDLRNVESALDTRIDWVMARDVGRVARAELLGASPEDRESLGLWPSDHAGVVARLEE